MRSIYVVDFAVKGDRTCGVCRAAVFDNEREAVAQARKAHDEVRALEEDGEQVKVINGRKVHVWEM